MQKTHALAMASATTMLRANVFVMSAVGDPDASNSRITKKHMNNAIPSVVKNQDGESASRKMFPISQVVRTTLVPVCQIVVGMGRLAA
jgi:hypothetical protein